MKPPENSLVLQWLGFCTFIAEGIGSTPGQGTNIPQASWHDQKKKKIQQTNKKPKWNIYQPGSCDYDEQSPLPWIVAIS